MLNQVLIDVESAFRSTEKLQNNRNNPKYICKLPWKYSRKFKNCSILRNFMHLTEDFASFLKKKQWKFRKFGYAWQGCLSRNSRKLFSTRH